MRQLFGFILLCIPCILNAQSYNITGSISDENGTLLPGAVIQLEYPWEEIIESQVSTKEGNFTFKNIERGGYQIRISFLSYAVQIVECNLTNQDYNLGIIKLEKANLELEEFEIKEKAPIAQIVDDTTQYNASAFKTLNDANTEDLLEKMPGISNSNGELQAQGEKVERILVDGKPFFGNNTKAAVQNLPADMVDKIQIYDEKSQQAQFTGFDDGETTKTINIITKRDRKTGQFGRLYGSIGDNSKYKVGGNASLFNGDQRISIIGMSNNINIQNFSSEDLLGISNSKGRRRGSWRGGNSNFTVPQASGISQTHALGFNYNDQLGEKVKISFSYFGNLSENILEEETQRYFVGRTINQTYYEEYTALTQGVNHRFNMDVNWKIDSLNSINVRPRLSIQSNTDNSYSDANTILVSDALNAFNNDYNSDLSGYNFRNNILWRRKFRNNKNTFSLNINSTINSNEIASKQRSDNVFYVPIETSEIIDQETAFTTVGWQTRTNASFTIPHKAFGMFSISADFDLQEERIQDYTRNLDTNTNTYSDIDEILSGENNYFTQTNSFNLGYNYRKGKDVFILARLKAQQARLDGETIFPQETSLSKNFQAILPFALARINISKTENLRIFYRSSANIPSGNDLNFVLDNSNPVQLSIGNPDLNQSISHRVFFRYQKTNAEKANLFYANIGFTYTDNYIGTAVYLPGSETQLISQLNISRSAQLTQKENLDGYWSSNAYVTYGLPVSKIKSNLNLSLNGAYIRRPGLIDELYNYSNNTNAGLGLGLSSNFSKSIDFNLSSNTAYNWVVNTIQKQLDANFVNQRTSFKFAWVLKEKLITRSNITHQYYKGLSDNLNQSFFLWSASLGIKLLKDQQAELAIEVFDILNQNQALVRNVTEIYYEDIQSNVLQQFFMLNFTYNFKNFNTGKKRSMSFDRNAAFPYGRG
jgi:hypothetical protein